MNPNKHRPAQTAGFQMTDYKSPYERDLENAKQYYGDEFPGGEGLTCLQCGAAVNLGWRHLAWHESLAG